ncbi:methyltransferase domain-containing protein [Nostoc sp. KVJ3]|uniref:class I SAM-dependent methyltransferase n=1 Tax=Nostoc sp. KVJ3 TaxID=457945 RepID=UPI00223896C0|nr:class I SAM-dependent methyltransferase [Nostoc sp. KVJ3]MCW5314789.1 methyltransferase domain-containing protein [Nostoc sp. KVJ3]
MLKIQKCWCGSTHLNYFSPEYSICQECSTLVSQCGLSVEETVVENDQEDFYGKKYWFSHMDELGFPDIYQRSRQDLPERCLYWLCTLLKYKLPPARVIELGCAHGGLVGLMKWSGFNAIGSEMSPWVVSFAREAFDIPMLLGKIGDQKFQFEKEEKFDAIILNDVLEHLPEPLVTMEYCASLLKEDAIFIIQMPCYGENRTYEDMINNNDIFLGQMKADEHLYLFNKNSAKELLNRIGFNVIEFEEPIFYFYDMYLIASKKNIVKNAAEKISQYLLSHPSGRLIQALIDKSEECKANYDNLQINLLRNVETQSQLQQTQSQLQQTQSQLQQTQSQLQQTQSQLQQTQSQLQQTQSQLQQTQSQLQQTEERIAAIESSKFWKIRQAWFRIKQRIGLRIN